VEVSQETEQRLAAEAAAAARRAEQLAAIRAQEERKAAEAEEVAHRQRAEAARQAAQLEAARKVRNVQHWPAIGEASWPCNSWAAQEETLLSLHFGVARRDAMNCWAARCTQPIGLWEATLSSIFRLWNSQAKEAALPEEPPAKEADLTCVLRFADGTRLSRRFRTSDLLQTLFDFTDAKVKMFLSSYNQFLQVAASCMRSGCSKWQAVWCKNFWWGLPSQLQAQRAATGCLI